MTPDDELRARQRSRNLVLGLVLVGLVVLFYFITIARMS
jgi:uncharacterized membrane protein YccC